MTVNEVREIRERLSLEARGMSTEEQQKRITDGAADAKRKIEEIRKKKGIVFTSVLTSQEKSEAENKKMQKNEHAFIRGAEYYANLSKTNASANTGSNIAVHEPTENYDSND